MVINSTSRPKMYRTYEVIFFDIARLYPRPVWQEKQTKLPTRFFFRATVIIHVEPSFLGRYR